MSEQNSHWPPSAAALRATFDAAPAYTVGLEQEVMLLAPDSLELAARAPELMTLLEDDSRFKLELPASQIEIVTAPTANVSDAAQALLRARHRLAERAAGLALCAAAGAHPFSSGTGQLNRLPQYERTWTEYRHSAKRQLVCADQVHVSAGGAERAIAVYNAARSHLPLLAALAANAPFYEGRDTGLASIRPQLARLLPRQGVPPVIKDWAAYAETFRWGAVAKAFPTAQSWWWELRLHPRFGTLEFRVPDTQATVAETAAIAALIQALVAWLGSRHDSGEQLPMVETWRIEENRWSACRYGVEGTMADLETGEIRPTRAWLEELLTTVAPIAAGLGSARLLERAAAMVEQNGAMQQRRAAVAGGAHEAARWLTERFLLASPG